MVLAEMTEYKLDEEVLESMMNMYLTCTNLLSKRMVGATLVEPHLPESEC